VIHVRALRGATTLDADSADQMAERVPELMLELLGRNDIGSDDVISVLFVSTPDITCLHPATAVRGRMAFDDVPMTGAQELDVPGSVELCVRVMMHIETERDRADLKHVYLHGAVVLRPDLAENDT